MSTMTAALTRMPETESAEAIRLSFAEAWGEMGLSWGVPPSVAKVHGYFLASDGPLTEREVREGLGLSHRAASLALAECEEWGLIERIDQPRRVGRRGPSAVAYRKVGDHWVWFQRITEARRAREADPVIPMIESCLGRAAAAASHHPGDERVVALRDWLQEFLAFVRLFDRALAILGRTEPASIARGFDILSRLPDDTIDRLLHLFGSLPEDELVATLERISQVSPSTAQRILSTVGRIARLGR